MVDRQVRHERMTPSFAAVLGSLCIFTSVFLVALLMFTSQ